MNEKTKTGTPTHRKKKKTVNIVLRARKVKQ
jgi:hypothetical protein